MCSKLRMYNVAHFKPLIKTSREGSKIPAFLRPYPRIHKKVLPANPRIPCFYFTRKRSKPLQCHYWVGARYFLLSVLR